jgi:tyrosine-protein kinase
MRTSHLKFIRRWWLTLLLAAIVAGVSGFLIADRLPATYQAEAKVLVGPVTADRDVLAASSSLVRTFAELAASQPVQQAALEQIGSSESAADIVGDVQVRADGETRLLTIQARRSSPEEAAELANAVATALRAVDTTLPRLPEGRLSVVEPATPPTERFGPQPAQVAVLAALAGFIAAVLLVVAVDYLSDYIGGPDELPSGLPLLGIVPSHRRARRGAQAPVVDAPASNAALLYQLLATRVIREGRQEPMALVVAGVARGEGAGEVAANLALAMRRNGRRVRLLDLDGERRLADQTMGGRGAARDDIVQYDLTKRSSRRMVRRAGQRPGGRTSQVESAEQTLFRLRADTDVVILVPPPLSVSPAAWMWSQYTDGAIVVVQSDHTGRRALEQTLLGATRAGAAVIGVVLRERVSPGRPLPPAAVPPGEPIPAPSPVGERRAQQPE